MTQLRILWHSVSPFTKTGYGKVTKYVALRIAQDYPLFISCYYGIQEGTTIKIGNTHCLPIHFQDSSYGEKAVKIYMKTFKCNLPILCSDFWPFEWFAKLPNSCFYGPVDCEDYAMKDAIKFQDWTYFIPCSKFGAKVYSKYTKKEPFAVIPHGVDTSIYRPLDKKTCRQHFNFPLDKFIIGIVAANNDPEPRKGWDKMFLALQQFLETNPDVKKKVFIFAFTEPIRKGGFDLAEMAIKCGLGDNLRFPQEITTLTGLSEEEMAKLYNTFDVLLLGSRREGFCLPILEAQACKVPVIAPKTSSIPELLQGRGFLARMKGTVFAPRGWRCQTVDEEDLAKKLEEAYFNKNLRQTYAKKGYKFAQTLDWNRVYEHYWKSTLKRLEEELDIKRRRII